MSQADAGGVGGDQDELLRLAYRAVEDLRALHLVDLTNFSDQSWLSDATGSSRSLAVSDAASLIDDSVPWQNRRRSLGSVDSPMNPTSPPRARSHPSGNNKSNTPTSNTRHKIATDPAKGPAKGPSVSGQLDPARRPQEPGATRHIADKGLLQFVPRRMSEAEILPWLDDDEGFAATPSAPRRAPLAPVGALSAQIPTVGADTSPSFMPKFLKWLWHGAAEGGGGRLPSKPLPHSHTLTHSL